LTGFFGLDFPFVEDAGYALGKPDHASTFVMLRTRRCTGQRIQHTHRGATAVTAAA
jgi:hypothetical protein